MLRLISAPGFFRLALAVIVVISHLSRLDIGRLGVLLFFYLSGYWVSLIWVKEFNGRAIFRFYLSRLMRIMPLFWIALALAAVLRHQQLTLPSMALLGIATTQQDPTGVAWSLDIELQFYLIVPILVPMLLQANRSLAAVIVVSVTIIAAAVAWYYLPRYEIVTVVLYLPAFVLGAVTYSTRWRPGSRAGAWSVALFAAATAAIALSPVTSSFLDKTVPDPFELDVFDFFWMLPILPFVAWSLTNASDRLDRHLGNLSFPLYLVHFPLIAVFSPVTKLEKVEVFVASMGLACLVYVACDRPIDWVRRRLTKPYQGDQPTARSVRS